MSVWKPSKSRRARNSGKKTFAVGALLIASAVTLGYVIGRYSNITGTSFYNQNNANTKYIRNTKKLHKKNILIFGDSTTWGFCPNRQERLPDYEQYPFILQQMLGYKEYHIIAEGLNGRTIAQNDIEQNAKNQRRGLSMNGLSQILPIIYSHKPLNMIVIMLGINDCKSHLQNTPQTIAKSMEKLIVKCIDAEIWPMSENESLSNPLILLLSPAYMRTLTPDNKEWGFDQNSIAISHGITAEYEKLAMKYKSVHFFDSNEFIESGSDSIHINGENNIKLAEELQMVICGMFSEQKRQKYEDMNCISFTSSVGNSAPSRNGSVQLSSFVEMENNVLLMRKLNVDDGDDDDGVVSDLGENDQPRKPNIADANVDQEL